MPEPFYFLCYSSLDVATAIKLADQLTKGPPSIAVWLDKRKIQPGIDWTLQIADALSTCAGVLYLMSEDSVSDTSECQQEWKRALTYKKPIIPLLFEKSAELPYRLAPRQYIDFTNNFDVGLATLRDHLRWRGTDEGALHVLKERLEDAKRDLKRASEGEAARILEEIDDLKQQIDRQRAIIADPEAAKRRADESISREIEREKAPAEPVAPKAMTKFINRLPMIPPLYFQDRHVETGLIGDFLKDESQRLMTVVGRGGVGKTAMVCRLLKALEGGKLPDDGGALAVDGIVYLSARAGHPVNFPNLFADLCKLLPETTAKRLDQLYRDAQQSPATQIQALLAAFPSGRTIVLLDNFEDVVDAENQAIKEQELDEALRTALEAPPHGVKFVLTTRVAPRVVLRRQPALQQVLPLDEGLASPHAENVLKAMDKNGSLGMREATAPLNEARIATRGYPRALEAIVGILRTDRSTTLAEVLADLRALHPTAEDVVRDLVGEAFSRLDPLAQEVMQALAVYGAPVPAVAVDYLLQPYRVGIDSDRVLGRLVNMQFARGEAGRYYLHQVDRGYALSRISQGEPEDRATEPPPFTRYALRHRAAEYFKETRKPREAWKTLDDLAPQISEFEVRIAGEEYDAAASVLLEIGFDYLLLWGHARLAAGLHERLKGRLTDRELMLSSSIDLGICYYSLGDYPRAIDHYQQALAIARDIGDRYGEGSALGNLGICYSILGDYPRAIDHYQQHLAIARDIGDRYGEGNSLGNLGICYSNLGDYPRAIDHRQQHLAIARDIGNRRGEGTALTGLGSCYYSLGDYPRAIDHYQQHLAIARDIGDRYGEAIALACLGDVYRDTGRLVQAYKYFQGASGIADATSNRQIQHEARFALALARLYAGDLRAACEAIEEAREYDYPQNTAAAWTATGIIRLRQGEPVAASKAFVCGLAEADGLLERSGRNVSALDTKGLALCGLALCKDEGHRTAAEEAFGAARKITQAKGAVARVLNQFDALALADTEGILTPARKAAEGQ